MRLGKTHKMGHDVTGIMHRMLCEMELKSAILKQREWQRILVALLRNFSSDISGVGFDQPLLSSLSKARVTGLIINVDIAASAIGPATRPK